MKASSQESKSKLWCHVKFDSSNTIYILDSECPDVIKNKYDVCSVNRVDS